MPDVAIALTTPLMSMTSPLGADVLIPAALGLEEALSEPYLCVLDVVSTRDAIDPGNLLHQPVCVTITVPQTQRRVHGLVRRFAATSPRGRNLAGYRMEIVPTLWFLSQTQDCRIFENKTTRDILQTIFSEHGLKVSFRVASGPKRPFTVQYNETDLVFATRLMQEDGWFYWFEHTTDSHTLVVADTTASFAKLPGGTLRPGPGEQIDILSTWHPGSAVTYGRVMMADYDPEQPSPTPKGETATTLATGGGNMRDPFYWPARSLTSSTIQRITRRRIEAAEATSALSQGCGFNPAFLPGARITVSERAGEDGSDFMLARASHHATDDTWRNGANPPSYGNSFAAFPAKMPWRPEPTLPPPRMDGVYSAVVIGPNGQEIHTDKLGRVKLRFQWDRRQDATPGGAIWVRVMQPWAGPNLGWSFVPRVGSEVAVAFMDGDPERPVVVGQLHNGNCATPWPLPDQKTRSGIRTRSTLAGGTDDYSELSFDDRKGSEEVLLHAQRDLKVEVEHDRSTTIKQGNDTLTVQGAVSVEAMESITLKVGENSIMIDQSGVLIKGLMVEAEGEVMATIKAPMGSIEGLVVGG
jgi:type VI secretion system secreted protein VgrG